MPWQSFLETQHKMLSLLSSIASCPRPVPSSVKGLLCCEQSRYVGWTSPALAVFRKLLSNTPSIDAFQIPRQHVEPTAAVTRFVSCRWCKGLMDITQQLINQWMHRVPVVTGGWDYSNVIRINRLVAAADEALHRYSLSACAGFEGRCANPMLPEF